MENWKEDSRKNIAIVNVDALVPPDHLLRKVERIMDYDWLHERLSPYYYADNGRPGADSVILIKMVLIQHLFGVSPLRQTCRDIQVSVAYRWFLGYSLLEEIPHFATVSYAFCKRFSPELSEEISAHILDKALNDRMINPNMVFVDGTHIKASANKKEFQKGQVAKAAKVYEEQLRKEVSEEREELGKKVNDDNDDGNKGSSGGGMVEKAVSKINPDCRVFIKGAHERQFAYEARAIYDRHGTVLGVEVIAENVSDSMAWGAVCDQVTEKFSKVEFVTMNTGYKTPRIAEKVLEHSRISILPYTQYKRKKDEFKSWDFTYDASTDNFTRPRRHKLRHTTTSKEGERTYRSSPEICRDYPCRTTCDANKSRRRMLTTHIWQGYLDLAEHLRKTERGKELYVMRKETIERVSAGAKEKHAMRYTHHRGLARVPV